MCIKLRNVEAVRNIPSSAIAISQSLTGVRVHFKVAFKIVKSMRMLYPNERTLARDRVENRRTVKGNSANLEYIC